MKGKILVIDDEIDVEKEICSMLESSGYETCTIPEHEFLLQALEERHPDLILMDINMPVTDGISLLIALKDSEKHSDVPVIMMTGHPDESTLGTCFDSGADDFVNKPIEEHILIARVKSVLQNRMYLSEIRRKNAEIEEQNKDIIESIKYGQTIQEALFHSFDKIQRILPNSFIFFKPKHIVSGDFYWVEEVDGKIFVAVADCTGHGVPGAFMSMLGYALMNQIITQDKNTDPGVILGKLHNSIRHALKQDLQKNNDGMDLGLCVIDKAQNTLEFSGAYNLLLRVNGEESKHFSGNKYPVGGTHHRFKGEREFSKTTIELRKGDVFYMYSDGFPDQFGGENGRKFMKKYLHELLMYLHEQPFERQRDELDAHLHEWRGEHPQIDDVLVMGFSINP